MVKTFHHSRFGSVQNLLEVKQRKKSRISVVIPALNEAATIGRIISCIHSELIEKFSFIDELIVIDSKSEDDTFSIASECGAKVYRIDEIEPHVSIHGKGAALWKSQFILEKSSSPDDIVIFVDSDIINFTDRFITGLAGPLLHDDDLGFVKAFYNRPLILDSQLYENQGGRVTEILVRPLVCALVPELAHVFQPLAGEYAFRRSLMETLPFWSGYGVEIGLLFSVYFRYGLRRIAQVDMDKRFHRNRDLHELGKMAFNILHVIFTLIKHEKTISFDQLNRFMVSYNGIELEKTVCDEKELISKMQLDLESKSGVC